MDKEVLKNLVEAYVRANCLTNITLNKCEEIAVNMLSSMPGIGCTRDDIINILTEEYNIHYQPQATIIIDDEEQQDWLTQFKVEGKSDWKFWRDYKSTMTLPPSSIIEIDNTTDRILNMMANPQAGETWYKSGLVVGNVQSGKTGNFIGLINKSLDVGFKIILVLTGMYDDLRAQTQMRIDKGVIGKISDPDNSRYGQKIGVGIKKGHKNVLSLTSSNLKGDFRPAVQNVHGVLSSSDPTIIVCKKNSSVLKNLLKFFAAAGSMDADGYKIITNTPLLVVDDEADSASIGIGQEEISKINGGIRAILALFAKAAYVGYTATPYANIFISKKENVNSPYLEIDNAKYRLGKYDIFPRNFIVNLTAPNNYIGANVIFGIPSKYGDNADPLPIVTEVKDGYTRIRNNNFPGYIPNSLKDAILHYFVATAIRRARGQKKAHSSMLINVSQYVNWQDNIWTEVNTYVSEVCDKIDSLATFRKFEDTLKAKYELIISTNREICGIHPEWIRLMPIPTWDSVKEELRIVSFKVKNEVRVLHSVNADTDPNANTTRLDYINYEDQQLEINNGLYVIAIGGNTLSRGLTLEGLCVSYFLRTSKTYDTLMQMGRWYGYRDGYVDVSRLYLQPDMITDLTIIAKATQEMRDQFDDMCERKIKPIDYGLKVMCVPGHLEATSRNKFGDTQTGQLSYSMSTVQAYQVLKNSSSNPSNKKIVEDFLSSLGAYEKRTRKGHEMKHLFWHADANSVVKFVKDFNAPDVQLNPSLIEAFISNQNRLGNLTDWTVALINVGGDGGRHKQQILELTNSTLSIGRTQRKATVIKDDDTNVEYYVIKNASVTGPEYDSLDLSESDYDLALEKSKENYRKAKAEGKTKSQKEPTVPDRNEAKLKRDPKNGLLLLFPMDLGSEDDLFTYVISFPKVDGGFVGYTYRGQANAFTIN